MKLYKDFKDLDLKLDSRIGFISHVFANALYSDISQFEEDIKKVIIEKDLNLFIFGGGVFNDAIELNSICQRLREETGADVVFMIDSFELSYRNLTPTSLDKELSTARDIHFVGSEGAVFGDEFGLMLRGVNKDALGDEEYYEKALPGYTASLKLFEYGHPGYLISEMTDADDAPVVTKFLMFTTLGLDAQTSVIPQQDYKSYYSDLPRTYRGYEMGRTRYWDKDFVSTHVSGYPGRNSRSKNVDTFKNLELEKEARDASPELNHIKIKLTSGLPLSEIHNSVSTPSDLMTLALLIGTVDEFLK